jgi:DNA-directed RNA polymerase specialized sigma24 family protein
MTSLYVVRKWLENWEAMTVEGRRFDDIPRNAGPQNVDGVGYKRLTKIKIVEAIKALPREQRNVVVCRYIHQRSLGENLKLLGMQRARYYAVCDQAVKNVWRGINGWPMKAPQAAKNPDITEQSS